MPISPRGIPNFGRDIQFPSNPHPMTTTIAFSACPGRSSAGGGRHPRGAFRFNEPARGSRSFLFYIPWTRGPPAPTRGGGGSSRKIRGPRMGTPFGLDFIFLQVPVLAGLKARVVISNVLCTPQGATALLDTSPFAAIDRDWEFTMTDMQYKGLFDLPGKVAVITGGGCS